MPVPCCLMVCHDCCRCGAPPHLVHWPIHLVPFGPNLVDAFAQHFVQVTNERQRYWPCRCMKLLGMPCQRITNLLSSPSATSGPTWELAHPPSLDRMEAVCQELHKTQTYQMLVERAPNQKNVLAPCNEAWHNPLVQSPASASSTRAASANPTVSWTNCIP